ncbi:hypothetical protein K2O51_31280 (plasmid) [Cupriavidus pinatubonensis]|uniref:hypothetical protein n=1 Tax=Cupriavidus pinatubonensis TaxID=248026 RepID=UPI001C72C15C|nr:hypothetical protein [Cupriavidus pinatubonensis]QYY33727.1 hypothetical protein K2O51_31280 [Cupriavidus pinatubonensis]
MSGVEREIHGLFADGVASVLYGTQSPLGRAQIERSALRKLVAGLPQIVSQPEPARSHALEQVNALLKRLSGDLLLEAARAFQEIDPKLIIEVSELAAMREHVTSSRSWAALFNPNSLARLAAAIRDERTLPPGGETGEL